jgi:nitrite reductase/ring-hydroxylating ferredoxin subunit
MAAAETPNLPEGADDAQVGRRVVLRGISAMGLAAFAAAPLAACGGGDDEPSVAAPEATPEASVEATPSATATKPGKATKSPKPEATASTQATKTATAEATPKTTPKATPKPAGGAKLVKASNTPLAAATDVPVGSGALFELDEYVVTQPKANTFIGFTSLCTHEQCPVDVFDTPGEMACSCHSSIFDLTTGAVKSGPARKPLPKKPIIVEGGQIYKAKPA